jgi:nucleotide-binding universal stress UspA family protein
MSQIQAPPAMMRILVGIDGTSASWDALSWATDDLAVRPAMDGPRRLAMHRTYPSGTLGAAIGNPPDMARLTLADPGLARRFHQVRQMLADDDVTLSVHTSDLSDRLIAAATADSTVVIAAPDRDINTATRIAAHAPGVVVAVRPTTPAPDVTAGPFAGHVVIGVADGASAQAAVRFAFDYADRHHKPVAAVHADAIEPAGAWVEGEHPTVHLIPYAFDLDLLDAALADAHAAHPTVPVRRFILREHAGQALVSASSGAVLLVVGDRGRNQIARRVLGSVSRHVVRHAHCSVAVVHDPGGMS